MPASLRIVETSAANADASLDRRIDARTLPRGVLAHVHVRDRLVAGRHRGEAPVAAERHADAVSAADGGPGEGHRRTP
jgi:hypothetical protein